MLFIKYDVTLSIWCQNLCITRLTVSPFYFYFFILHKANAYKKEWKHKIESLKLLFSCLSINKHKYLSLQHNHFFCEVKNMRNAWFVLNVLCIGFHVLNILKFRMRIWLYEKWIIFAKTLNDAAHHTSGTHSKLNSTVFDERYCAFTKSWQTNDFYQSSIFIDIMESVFIW